jgi:hypothetical protein
MIDRKAYTGAMRLSCARSSPAIRRKPKKTADRPSRAVRRILPESYCFFSGAPVLGGVLLPEPMPLLGVLGDVVLPLPLVLGEVLPEVLGEVPPAAPLVVPVPEPKCASHSARVMLPSLFLSTSEKLGVLLLAPADAEPLLGALDEPEAPVELLPEAPAAPLPEAPAAPLPDAPVELLPDALGAFSPLEAPLDDEPELCAMATLARAKSAAVVATLMSFNIWSFLLRRWM